jgi:glycosyltransferase involved in cell wall biosynthesis
MSSQPHVVIDARLYGPLHTGIGRYTQNLLLSISRQPKQNFNFTLIVYRNLLDQVKAQLGNSFHYVPTTIPHYSLTEQTRLPQLLSSLNPHLVHFTHFNKPLLYTKPSLITIHDLIKHYYYGPQTSTKDWWFYWPKYFSYRLLTDYQIRHNPLIVPSYFWKDIITKRYHLPPSQVTVTHEAVDPKFLSHPPVVVKKPQNYLIYTGNLYPHKNLTVVLQALTKLPDLKLKIISARSFFTKTLTEQIRQFGLQSQVEFLGYLDDSQFSQLYSHALALVHPSLMEGFSLTGLEAMSLNCPVISSNYSCLPEIYGHSVLYFDPLDPTSLVKQINRLSQSLTQRLKLINLGRKQISRYSWDTTARQTLDLYHQLLKKEN